MKITWTEELSVGIAVIDQQHQHFVAIINKMYEAQEAGKSQEALGEILAEVTEYANYHFATEEKYFTEFKYKDSEEHIAEHKKMLKRLSHLTDMYKQGASSTVIETIFFLEDWLKDHLAKMDRKYIDCFHDHGLV